MADHMTTPFPRPWTAGPWEYRPDSATIHAGDFGGPLGDGHIATMAEYDANEPDARLIAAAPELFEALSALAQVVDAMEYGRPHAQMDAARAALAKALGTEVTDAGRTEALAQEMAAEPAEAEVRASIEASRQPGDCPECGCRRFVLDPERGGGACPACEEASK